MFNNERTIKFFRIHAIRIGISLLIVLALILAVSDPVSRAVSDKPHGSASTVFTAAIRPHGLATLSSKFPGQVAATYVSPGAKVKSGDPLLTLSDPDLELEYERARVHLDATMRRLNNNQRAEEPADSTRAERTLRAAKERLSQFSLDAVERNNEKADAHAREIEKLVEQRLATGLELDEARRTAAYALRDLQNEREHLSRLKEEADVAAFSVNDGRRLFHSPGASENLNLKMELQEAETALRIADRRRGSQQIVSTTSGTVLKLMVNAGDQIPSGIPLVQIGQMDLLDFTVPVDSLIAHALRVGQRVKVRIPTEPPRQIVAPIAVISLAPSQEQSAYSVVVTTSNPAPSDLLVGLSAEVEFPHQ